MKYIFSVIVAIFLTACNQGAGLDGKYTSRSEGGSLNFKNDGSLTIQGNDGGTLNLKYAITDNIVEVSSSTPSANIVLFKFDIEKNGTLVGKSMMGTPIIYTKQ